MLLTIHVYTASVFVCCALAQLWDAETGALYHTYKGHATEIVCLSFDPLGTTIATGSMDNSAKLWDVETGAEKHTLLVGSAETLSRGGECSPTLLRGAWLCAGPHC